ncbi:MAG: hypothetical protein WD096_04535 [Actinomycetota bacterium]
MFRRRREPPADLRAAEHAFHAVLDLVEPAKAGLADVLPTTRMPGRPFGHALAEFVQRLEEAKHAMIAWPEQALTDHRVACDAALQEALDRAHRISSEGRDVAGFEALLWLVESLLDPLEPFAEAEFGFRDRRRGRRVRSD